MCTFRHCTAVLGAERDHEARTGNYLLVRGCAFEKALLGEAFWARDYFCATMGQMTEDNDPAVLGVSF